MGDASIDKTAKNKNRETYYENFKMPKNIRQIGNISDLSKIIYVEDYVMSYMKQLSKKEQSEFKVAILLGKYIYNNNEGKCIFIKGAIEAKDVNVIDGDVFTDEMWTSVYEEIKKYFFDVEIVGWAIVGLGIMLNIEDQIKSLHIKNFHGPNKLLFKLDIMENEEEFYFFENNQMIKQKGYYIYYEKNEEMQNYMVACNKEEKKHEEYNDITTKKIRNIIEEKENTKKDKGDKNIARLTYAAGTIMAIIVLVVSTTMLRNYHQMKNLEVALDSLSKSIKETSETSEELEASIDNNKDNSGQGTVDLEVVSGNVENSEESISDDENNHEQETINEEKVTEQALEETETVTSETETGETEKVEETEGTEEIEETEAETKAETNEAKFYIVRPGDSLASICRNLYNDDSQAKVEEIISLNKIDNQDKIYVGQQLIVP